MSLDKNYTDAKKIDWLDFIIKSKLIEYEKYKKEKEKKEIFNPASWSIFAASLSILIAVSPKDDLLTLSTSLLLFLATYFSIYLYFAPKIEKTIAIYKIKYHGANHEEEHNELLLNDEIEVFNNSVTNKLYLASSILNSLSKSSDINFKALQAYEIIKMLTSVICTLNTLHDYGDLIKSKSLIPLEKISLVKEITSSLLGNLESEVKENKLPNSINKELDKLKLLNACNKI